MTLDPEALAAAIYEKFHLQSRPRKSLSATRGDIDGPQCFMICTKEGRSPEGAGEGAAPRGSSVLGFTTEQVAADYWLGPEIGKGLTGVVRLAQEMQSGHLRACKTITKEKLKKEISPSELRSEIRAMQAVAGHPNVVELRGLFEDEQAVHLVMDLCPGGELFTYIKSKRRLDEPDAIRIFRQMASALEHCHRRGVIHRDVKPENILISKMVRNSEGTQIPRLKLVDFGLALKLPAGQKAQGKAGTPMYMAPEVVKGESYGFEADVWSLGVALYVALSGFLPFAGRNNDEIFASILRTSPDFTQKPWPSISEEAKELLRWMLTSNPMRRASAADVLSHPWMKKYLSSTTTPTSARPPSPPSLPTSLPIPMSPPRTPSCFPEPSTNPSLALHTDHAHTHLRSTHSNSNHTETPFVEQNGVPIRLQRTATPPATKYQVSQHGSTTTHGEASLQHGTPFRGFDVKVQNLSSPMDSGDMLTSPQAPLASILRQSKFSSLPNNQTCKTRHGSFKSVDTNTDRREGFKGQSFKEFPHYSSQGGEESRKEMSDAGNCSALQQSSMDQISTAVTHHHHHDHDHDHHDQPPLKGSLVSEASIVGGFV